MKKKMKYPPIVYKYRHWQNLECNKYDRHPLTHRELYFASPKQFNDPFDCRIPVNFSLLDTIEKKKQYVDQMMIKLYDTLVKNNHDIEKEIIRFDHRMNDLNLLQKEWEKVKYGADDEKLGIIALCSNWDEILMWSHYADNHQGYCIGFDENALQESGLVGVGGLVHYPTGDNLPIISPLDQYNIEHDIKIEFTKSQKWQYEKEYRLTKLFENNDDRKTIIPKELFKEIVIGCNSTKDTEEDILKENSKELNIPVFRAEKVPFKFQLNRKRIA